MSLMAWIMFALAAAGAWAIVAYLYQRRETPGHGRTLLAGLRWAALCLLALLVLDPHLPVPGIAAGGPDEFVLVDASLSMSLPTGPDDSTSRWERAVAEARPLAEGAQVVLFGGTPRVMAADSLAGSQPSATSSRLFPAIRTAAEAGAERVTVFTDGGIADAGRVERAQAEFDLVLDMRPLAGSGGAANRSLIELEAPSWAETGDSIRVRAEIAAHGDADDSIAVRVEHDGNLVARTRVAAPAPGRSSTAVLAFEPGAAIGEQADNAGERVRFDVTLEDSDAVPDDNQRTAYIHVSERPAGVTLVSFGAGWGPRFLAPALSRALGIPVHGFIRVDDGRYLEVASGRDAGTVVDSDEVQRLAQSADMLVLHGLTGDAPDWAARLASEAPRVLIFPAAEASALDLPVELADRRSGEWYVSNSVPASPVAALLAGLRLDGLPPLAGPLMIADETGVWSPLSLRLNRRGDGVPLLAAGGDDDRRWAVALARGYWRWAFRGGTSRQAYHRLWSAVAGWLMERQGGITVAAVRPETRVVRRGEPIRWMAPGLSADSVALRITRPDGAAAEGTPPETRGNEPAGSEDGAVVLDTVLPMVRGDTAALAALPPGHYRYSARAFANGEPVAAAEGPFTVASYSPEFSRPRVALTGLGTERDASRDATNDAAKTAGVPLHATPWPYILLLGLLCTEWALRRRWGLR